MRGSSRSQRAHPRLFEWGGVEWWVLIPGGLLFGYVVLTAALWLGTFVVGADAGWASPADMLGLVWAMLSLGHRLDEAWLLGGHAHAVAAAGWLWGIATTVAVALCGTGMAVWEWWQADLPLPKGKPKARRMKEVRLRDWPIKPPYSPTRPGAGLLLGHPRYRRGKVTVAVDGLPGLVIGPTGSGKTRHVIGPNIAHWPGPVVATSVKTDLAELTLPHRQPKGRVFGYEPTGRLWPWMQELGITPVVWDPVAILNEVGATRENADLLAQFLSSQSSAHQAGSAGLWARLSHQVISQVLLVAAETGHSLYDAQNWLANLVEFRQKEIDPDQLSAQGKLSMKRLREMAAKDPKLLGSVEVSILEVANALTFTAENPDAPSLPTTVTTADSQDTLYLIADHLSQGTHQAVFAAVLRHLFHLTETHHPPAGEEPPRPLFALDELANLARLKDFPQVLSTIRSPGQVLTGLQELSQLVAGWGRDNATTIIGNHPTKIQLGGSSDASQLQAWATLSGKPDDDNKHTDPASWRKIKPGRGRVLAGDMDPFDLRLVKPQRWLNPLGEKPERNGSPPTPTPPTRPTPGGETAVFNGPSETEGAFGGFDLQEMCQAEQLTIEPITVPNPTTQDPAEGPFLPVPIADRNAEAYARSQATAEDPLPSDGGGHRSEVHPDVQYRFDEDGDECWRWAGETESHYGEPPSIEYDSVGGYEL